MPSKTPKQQRAAGAALAAKKKGEKPSGKGAVATMAKSMTKNQLRDFASDHTSPGVHRRPKGSAKLE